MTYSPDTLALNPAFAKQRKRSRAKTVSRKGHGHTDDSQTMAAAGKYVQPSAGEMLRTLTEQYIGNLQLYAPQCGIDKERLAAVLVALGRVMGE